MSYVNAASDFYSDHAVLPQCDADDAVGT